VLGLGRESTTFRADPQRGELDRAPGDPELDNRATAYYQTAFRLFRDSRYR
jgi:hypothetical protein